VADANTNNTGSPTGGPLYLSVGFLRRPHGVRGEIIMDLHTDYPERMKKGRNLFVGDEHKQLTLTNVRPHQSGLLVKFQGIDTPEDAGHYRNQWVYVQTKEVPLPDGQHYKHELLGLKVLDEHDNLLGELVEIMETGANDVYIVQDESGKEILLPVIPSVILDLNIDRGFLMVHLLEGL